MSGERQIRVQVRYTGHVQGVGFRFTCSSIASSHPVSGWVRNESDGTVTLEAQGTHQAVEQFLSDVSERMGSKIQSAHRTPAAIVPAETDFVIDR